MFAVFGILVIIMLVSSKVHINGLDVDYLSMNNTLAIKGIFVVLIFLSHIRTYTTFTYSLDLTIIRFLDVISQLVVTMFLFYSGYGIYESIKTKDHYIQRFPKHRIAYIFLNLVLGLCLYMILNIFIHKSYPISDILLSFIGLKSIGNSSWFMFAILVLYITTYLSFKIFKESKQAILSVTILSIIYIFVMTYFRYEPRYSCTHLCFSLGMWYSYYRNRIDAFLRKNNIYYYITTLLLAIGMIVMAIVVSQSNEFNYFSNFIYNLIAIMFSLFIVMCTMKISFHSRVLVYLGNHSFWYYILQRLPMNLFEYLHINDSPYLFFMLTIIILIILVEIMNHISLKLRETLL